jgi:hypothetical protein
MPQTINLSDEVRAQKGSDLCKLIEVDLRDRQWAIAKRQVARNLYFGVSSREPRYEGASNIHLPVLEEKVEGMVPKLVNAFHAAEPTVHVRRLESEYNEDLTEKNEKFLNWALDSDIPNFYHTFESWVRNMLLDGTATLKVYWEQKWRNTVEVCGVKHTWQAGQHDLVGQPVQEDRPRMVIEGLAEQFPGLVDVYPEDGAGDPDRTPMGDAVGTSYRIEFVENRRAFEDVRIEFAPSQYVDEVDLYIYRPIMYANRPCVEVVEYEDLIVPYATWSLQESPRVAHRYWLTIDELKAKVDEEGWQIDDEDFDRLKSASKGEDRRERDPYDRTLSRQKDVSVGETPAPSAGTLQDDEAAYVDGKFMVYEVYATDDVNEDGYPEEVVYQIPACLKKVVRTHYLEELFPHGRRPFPEAHYKRVSDRWYSRSLGEQLTPINLEVDSIINMVNEAQELINNPFFFYVPHANTVDPAVLEGISPGQGIPVSDPNAVMFPKFPQEPLANLSAIDSMLLFADRLTISPQAVGSSQSRNAPRTARGTLALLSESGIQTDVVITGLQKSGWRELVHQLHALYHEYGDDEIWYHVTGAQEPQRITKDELRGRFTYSFHGNSVNTNREVLRSIAQVRYQTLIVNPLYGQDMNAMLALTEDFLRHFAEGTDTDKLTPKLPGQGGSHPPMVQATENKLMSDGVAVEVLPLDDHMTHLQELDKFTTSPAFEQLPESAVMLIAMHKTQHEQMLRQQLAQQGGGVAQGGGGMANNVPTGMSNAQTQTDLNALEGGVM